jgi:hypothetical protein
VAEAIAQAPEPSASAGRSTSYAGVDGRVGVGLGRRRGVDRRPDGGRIEDPGGDRDRRRVGEGRARIARRVGGRDRIGVGLVEGEAVAHGEDEVVHAAGSVLDGADRPLDGVDDELGVVALGVVDLGGRGGLAFAGAVALFLDGGELGEHLDPAGDVPGVEGERWVERLGLPSAGRPATTADQRSTRSAAVTACGLADLGVVVGDRRLGLGVGPGERRPGRAVGAVAVAIAWRRRGRREQGEPGAHRPRTRLRPDR